MDKEKFVILCYFISFFVCDYIFLVFLVVYQSMSFHFEVKRGFLDPMLFRQRRATV